MMKFPMKTAFCAAAFVFAASASAATAYAGTTSTPSTNHAVVQTSQHKGHGPDKFIQDMSKIIGVDASELKQQLMAGKSLADVAKSKGMSETTLIAKIKENQKQHLSQAVKAGKLTQAQANSRSEWFDRHATKLVERKGMPPHRHHRHHHMLKVAATVIGMSEPELKTQLKSGKTIAEVAQSKGITQSVLVTKMTATMKTKLDQKVASGKMTKAQASDMLSRFQTHVKKFIVHRPVQH